MSSLMMRPSRSSLFSARNTSGGSAPTNLDSSSVANRSSVLASAWRCRITQDSLGQHVGPLGLCCSRQRWTNLRGASGPHTPAGAVSPVVSSRQRDNRPSVDHAPAADAERTDEGARGWPAGNPGPD
jgi:hypothetical protein